MGLRCINAQQMWVCLQSGLLFTYVYFDWRINVAPHNKNLKKEQLQSYSQRYTSVNLIAVSTI